MSISANDIEELGMTIQSGLSSVTVELANIGITLNEMLKSIQRGGEER